MAQGSTKRRFSRSTRSASRGSSSTKSSTSCSSRDASIARSVLEGRPDYVILKTPFIPCAAWPVTVHLYG